MARALCPECGSLETIEPTGKRRHPTRGTDTWWIVTTHRDRRNEEPRVCDGSGALV